MLALKKKGLIRDLLGIVRSGQETGKTPRTPGPGAVRSAGCTLGFSYSFLMTQWLGRCRVKAQPGRQRRQMMNEHRNGQWKGTERNIYSKSRWETDNAFLPYPHVAHTQTWEHPLLGPCILLPAICAVLKYVMQPVECTPPSPSFQGCLASCSPVLQLSSLHVWLVVCLPIKKPRQVVIQHTDKDSADDNSSTIPNIPNIPPMCLLIWN